MQDVLIYFEFWKKCNMFGIVTCAYTGTHQSERDNGTDTTLKTNNNKRNGGGTLFGHLNWIKRGWGVGPSPGVEWSEDGGGAGLSFP